MVLVLTTTTCNKNSNDNKDDNNNTNATTTTTVTVTTTTNDIGDAAIGNEEAGADRSFNVFLCSSGIRRRAMKYRYDGKRRITRAFFQLWFL